MPLPAPLLDLIRALAAHRHGDRAQARALCEAHGDVADFRYLSERLDQPLLLPAAVLPAAVPAGPDHDDLAGQALAFAWEHHLAGRQLLAWLGYVSALICDPARREALDCFGALKMQRDDLAGSLALLARTARTYGLDDALESKFGALAVKCCERLDGLLHSAADARTAFTQLAPRFCHSARFYHHFALLIGRTAVARLKQGCAGDAAALGRLAIILDPTVMEFHCNLGYIHEMSGRFQQAGAPYQRGMTVAPDPSRQAYASQMLLHLSLRLGQWDRFASLLPYKHNYAPLGWWKDFHPAPQWDGVPRPGQSLLLTGESGFGDVIQCIRYATHLQHLGMTVHVLCDRRLVALCRLVPGVASVHSFEQMVPRTDWRALSFDLFYKLEQDPRRTICSAPYIDMTAAGLQEPRLTRRDGELLIGIKWTTTDPAKDLPLAAFARLRLHPGVRLISLQPEPPDPAVPEEQALAVERPLDPYFSREDSFLVTAHVIRQLDLVITADSVIAHLAGAVGVEGWVALKAVPDWRWLIDGTTSPLYDTLTLFRQPLQDSGWSTVFDALEAALRQRLGIEERPADGAA